MRTMIIRVFKDATKKKRQWRWQMKYGNRILGDSGESYHNRSDCLRSLRRLIERIYDRNYTLVDEGKKA